jgi:hypothetical protein
MSWSIRLKLNMLPVLDSNGIDEIILSRDIYARLGLPRDLNDKLKNKTAVKVFYSAASAEGYADERICKRSPIKLPGIRAWKRLGHCLVFLSCPYATPIPGMPPIPSECIVRTAESAWELYNFLDAEESKVDQPS